MSHTSVSLSGMLLLAVACRSKPDSTARGIDLPSSRAATEPSLLAPGAHRTPIRLPARSLGQSAASELAVRVVDPSKLAVESARVTVGGQSVAVDANGDATITGREAGSTAVIRADADGYLGVVRRVESLEPGLTRTTLVLTEIPTQDEPQPWELADWAELTEQERTLASEDGSFEVILPETLLDPLGDVYEGLVDVVFATYETHGEAAGEDPLAASPGPLLAESGSGTPTTLVTLGMLGVELTGADGVPLTLGEPARVSRVVPEDARGLVAPDGANLVWWNLDPDLGLWMRYDGDGSPEYDEATGIATGELPHFCAVNLDLVWTKRTEALAVAASETAMRGAEVRLYGQGMDLRVPADAQMTWKNLPPGDLLAELYVYDALVDGPVTVSDDDETDATLSYDEPEATSGEIPVTLRLRSGDCPSDADRVTFSHKDAETGAVDWSREVTPLGDESTGRSLVVTSLPPGEYEVAAWLTSERVGLDLSMVLTPPESGETALYVLEMASGDARVAPGGCRALPCDGADCDSALVVSARDPDGAPTRLWGVRLDDGDAFAVREDVCIDLPGAADRRVTVIGPTGAEIAVELPRGGRCDALESAAEVTLISDETCADGAVGLEAEIGLLGPEDPRFYPIDTRIWPGVRTPGVVSLHAEVTGAGGDCDEDGMLPLFDWRPIFSPSSSPGQAPVATSCQADLTLTESWGWISVAQEASGRLSPDGIHLRATPQGCTEQTCESIELDLSGEPGGELLGRTWDATTLEDLRDRLTLTLHVAGGETRARAAGGQRDDAADGGGGYDIPGLIQQLVGLTVSTNATGEIVVSFEDVVLSSATDRGRSDGTSLRMKHSLVLNGVWTAPMLSSADLPQDLERAGTRAAYGVSTKIVTAGGEGGGGLSRDDEPVLHCAAEVLPFYVRTVGGGDTVTGLSPLLVASGDAAQLWSGPLGADDAAMRPSLQDGVSALSYSVQYLFKLDRGGGEPREVELDPYGHPSGALSSPWDVGEVSYSYVADADWSGAIWRLDRDWLAGLYDAAGLSEELIEASASVLASPVGCATGRCTFELALLDGSACGAVASPSTTGPVAAFLGLDETCGGLASWDNPFLLRWSIDDEPVGAALLLLERGAAAVVRGGDGLDVIARRGPG